MNFKKYLNEVVPNRPPITTTNNVEIRFIDPESDHDLASEVEGISNRINIPFNRNKDISIVALVSDTVIGGVASFIYHNDEYYGQPVRTYDFDVVVEPQWQGYQMVGFKLIEAAMREAVDNEANLIRAYVVNRRLIPILINRYGFEGNENAEADVLYKWI